MPRMTVPAPSQEQLRPIPHVSRDHPEQRAFVGRQLQNQHRSGRLEQGSLEQPGHQEGHHDPKQIHPEHDQPGKLQHPKEGGVGDARRDEHGVNRQSR